MTLRSATWWPALLGLVSLSGCYYPVRDKIDAAVCSIAKQPFDVPHPEAPDQQPLMPSTEDDQLTQAAYHPDEDELAQAPAGRGKGEPGKPYDPYEDLQKYRQAPLQVPPELLPDGSPSKLELAPLGTERRREQLRREFPMLRPPGPDYEGVPGPFGHPLTLAELQRIGMSSSPAIKQAVAAVEVARGNAYQAGLMPNPVMGFEVDTFGTTGGAGYVGGYMQQLIRTAGKLRLSRVVAAMDLRNAEVALRRAQMDLATRIRTYYFQLLVARENMRINRILVGFTNTVYEVQAGQVRGRAEFNVAPYEAMYLRALANTAHTNLVFARNNYVATWKQLTSVLGLPGMPLTQVAGQANMPMPLFDFAKVWNHVGRNHTDVVTAENDLQRARFSLLLAQVQPYPDVDVRFLLQKDYTGPPNEIAPSFAVSVPVPIWNRNQGGIAAAQADVVRMGEEPLRVRNDLYYRLSDAYGRYRTFHQNLILFRDKILPDLVRVYDAIYRRYQLEVQTLPPGGVLPPPVTITPPGINDVVVAQQLLVTNIASYITNLGGLWQAVVDVTDLIQTNDMFRIAGQPLPTEAMPALPDLEQLKPLLPTHPCSPLPDPHLRGGDGTWPEAIPTRNNFPMPPANGENAIPQSGQPKRPAVPPPSPAAPQAPAAQQPAMLPDLRPIAQAPPARQPLSARAPEPPRVDPQLLEPPPQLPPRPNQ